MIGLRQHGLLALWVIASTTLGAACATTAGTPRPFPTPTDHLEPSSRTAPLVEAPVDAPAIVGTALGLSGTPYKNGGSDPAGFDCSGFTQYVFAQHGRPLPRDVRAQFAAGVSVSRDLIAPGDLVFFTTTAPGASHVGIVVDGDTFIHAPSSRGVVRVERLTSEYWLSRLVGVRRLVEGE